MRAQSSLGYLLMVAGALVVAASAGYYVVSGASQTVNTIQTLPSGTLPSTVTTDHPPTCYITISPTYPLSSDTVTITLHASDDHALKSAQLSLNGKQLSPCTLSGTTATCVRKVGPLSVGTYVVDGTVYDSKDQKGTCSLAFSVSPVPTKPPSIIILYPTGATTIIFKGLEEETEPTYLFMGPEKEGEYNSVYVFFAVSPAGIVKDVNIDCGGGVSSPVEGEDKLMKGASCTMHTKKHGDVSATFPHLELKKIDEKHKEITVPNLFTATLDKNSEVYGGICLYEDPGTYTIKITVTDRAGHTATKYISVYVSTKNGVKITNISYSPQNPTVGQTITFTCKASSGYRLNMLKLTVIKPDGSTLLSRVFHPGESVDAETVSFQSNTSGTYRLECIAEDTASNSAAASRIVYVSLSSPNSQPNGGSAQPNSGSASGSTSECWNGNAPGLIKNYVNCFGNLLNCREVVQNSETNYGCGCRVFVTRYAQVQSRSELPGESPSSISMKYVRDMNVGTHITVSGQTYACTFLKVRKEYVWVPAGTQSASTPVVLPPSSPTSGQTVTTPSNTSSGGGVSVVNTISNAIGSVLGAVAKIFSW